ncbi:unnamed protein product [Prorocentrum cordatum]|uniref:C3H1-type domain-containing protein n=1 Tax=Prorocentrum cordatum TaxID=2364126 RepID=A0ABN9UBM4_9DINO|nr:unnamed protein product [Polarella glacialis]
MGPDAGSECSFGHQTSNCGSEGDFGRQTTACSSEGGFNSQTTACGSEDDFGRQTSCGSEGDRRPAHRKSHKTRMCTFYILGRCRKDECTFAHGAHELSARAGSKGTPPAKQARLGPAGGGAQPTAGLSSAPPPRLPPAPSWLSEGTECAPDSPGRPSSDDGGAFWAPAPESCLGLPASRWPGAGGGEEECQLVVVNTFLTILESRPEQLRRSASTPPGR